ncbi:MAG: rhodanese-like domain-containing protein [Pseudomonadales bacterium]
MDHFFIFISQQWMLVSALLVLIYLFAMNERNRGGTVINHHQLTTLVNSRDAVVVDLRDKKERKAGFIVDSKHISFSQFDAKMAELEQDKDKPIILVDKMGQHTGSVGNKLKKAGFEVFRLNGGIAEWKNSNLPLVKG